jgi:hypothetical protein
MVFLVPILIYAIALLERDGLWTAIGHVGTLVNATLLVVFSTTVVAILAEFWQWLA